MLAADESFSEYSSDSASPPCDLGTIERLLRTHPVWFLPDIQRAGAVHLLQSKEHGVSERARDHVVWHLACADTESSSFRSAEFRRSRLQPGEHDGRLRSPATRHRAVHRALSDPVQSGCAQSGDVQVQVRLDSGADCALLAVLVSVRSAWIFEYYYFFFSADLYYIGNISNAKIYL